MQASIETQIARPVFIRGTTKQAAMLSPGDVMVIDHNTPDATTVFLTVMEAKVSVTAEQNILRDEALLAVYCLEMPEDTPLGFYASEQVVVIQNARVGPEASAFS